MSSGFSFGSAAPAPAGGGFGNLFGSAAAPAAPAPAGGGFAFGAAPAAGAPAPAPGGFGFGGAAPAPAPATTIVQLIADTYIRQIYCMRQAALCRGTFLFVSNYEQKVD
eukprot:2936-Heterococcus_DN1.PRE.1